MLIVYWLQFLRCDVVHVYHNKEKDNLHVIFLSSCINDKISCPFNRRSFFPIKLPLKTNNTLNFIGYIHTLVSISFLFFFCMLFIGRCFADTEKKKMISPQDTYNRNNRQINLSVSHLFLSISSSYQKSTNAFAI
jgi:hypothetical protein